MHKSHVAISQNSPSPASGRPLPFTASFYDSFTAQRDHVFVRGSLERGDPPESQPPESSWQWSSRRRERPPGRPGAGPRSAYTSCQEEWAEAPLPPRAGRSGRHASLWTRCRGSPLSCPICIQDKQKLLSCDIAAHYFLSSDASETNKRASWQLKCSN